MRDIYAYWMKKDVWQLRDAIVLLLGQNPDNNYGGVWEEYDFILELAMDAYLVKKLEFIEYDDHFPPSSLINSDCFITWAKSKNVKALPDYFESQNAKARDNGVSQERSHGHIVWLKEKWLDLGKPNNETFWSYIEKNADDIDQIDRVENDIIYWAGGRTTNKASLRNILSKFRNPKSPSS